MSVRAITRVFEASQHAGSELLMLVVLADYSDDQGNSYPSVASLARKCRMTTRNANYVLGALQASGELRVLMNQGPGGVNRYRLMLDRMGEQPLKPASPLKATSPPEAGFSPEAPFTLKPTSATPEAGFPKPLKPASDEPSLNRQEPSSTSPEAPIRKRATLPICDYDGIVSAYHEKLPQLVVVRVRTKKRIEAMRKRWQWVLTERRQDGTTRGSTAAEAMDWFTRFFERATHNDFIMGRTPPSPGHESWRADLDFLLSDKGLVQVLEKTEVPA